jgi:hypothetical protein
LFDVTTLMGANDYNNTTDKLKLLKSIMKMFDVNYPITVYNSGATKERWLILFKSTTTIDVIGENLGVLMANVSITSLPDNQLSVQNRLTGELYWTMHGTGFGVGYQSGNCIRFNTDAANYPISFVRTTLQAPPTEPTDSYIFQIRGDSA